MADFFALFFQKIVVVEANKRCFYRVFSLKPLSTGGLTQFLQQLPSSALTPVMNATSALFLKNKALSKGFNEKIHRLLKVAHLSLSAVDLARGMTQPQASRGQTDLIS